MSDNINISNGDHLSKILEGENVYTMDDDDVTITQIQSRKCGNAATAAGNAEESESATHKDNSGTSEKEVDTEQQQQQQQHKNRLQELMQKRQQLERFKKQMGAQHSTESSASKDDPSSRRDASINEQQTTKFNSKVTETSGSHSESDGDRRSTEEGGSPPEDRTEDNGIIGNDTPANIGDRNQDVSHQQSEDFERRQKHTSWQDTSAKRKSSDVLSPPAPFPEGPRQYQKFQRRPSSVEPSQNGHHSHPYSRSHKTPSLRNYRDPITREDATTYYFITKVYDYRDLEMAQDLGVWTIFKTEISNINLAVDSGEAILIFQLPKENRYFGYAQVTGPIARVDHKKNVRWFDKQDKKSCNFPIRFRAIDLHNSHATFRNMDHLRDSEGTPINSVKNGRQIPFEAGSYICDLLHNGRPGSHPASRQQYHGPSLSRPHPREQRFESEVYGDQFHHNHQARYGARDAYHTPAGYQSHHLSPSPSPSPSFANALPPDHPYSSLTPPPSDRGYQRSRYVRVSRYDTYYDSHMDPHAPPLPPPLSSQQQAWDTYREGRGDIGYHADHPRHPIHRRPQQFDYDLVPNSKSRTMYQDDTYAHYTQKVPHIPYGYYYHSRHNHNHPCDDYRGAPQPLQSSHKMAYYGHDHYNGSYGQQQQEDDPVHHSQDYVVAAHDSSAMGDGYREQRYNTPQYGNRYAAVDNGASDEQQSDGHDPDLSRDSKRRKR